MNRVKNRVKRGELCDTVWLSSVTQLLTRFKTNTSLHFSPTVSNRVKPCQHSKTNRVTPIYR